ncbi:MAG TPA: sigma-70 family RNA polymerase sigma factor [Ktedonobacteraceae bacterium]|jgi:RNA polymerase sigma-70 factor (ECF subfamily)|nr:sigma-70 family RNA polymerase sigma factor [Ktedonobacteraceae bacterium]
MQDLSISNRRQADGEETAPEEAEVARMTEEAGWIGAAQVDPVAFEPLYMRYRERVYRYVRTRLDSDEDAADLTQQVFLQAMAALPRYRPQGVPFAVWLFRIARHTAINRATRDAGPALSWDQLPETLHPLAGEGPEELAVRSEALEHLRALLSELEPAQRELLALRFAGGLTAPQIAELVGKKPEAVRKQIYRLLQSFKEHLQS